MSYSVSGTKIRLTRGDTAVINVTAKFKASGEAYTPQEGDKVKFSVKKSANDRTVLLEKNIPIDTMQLWINPEDTKPLRFGSYVYDIELTYANGDVDTFIPNGQLEITAEVG